MIFYFKINYEYMHCNVNELMQGIMNGHFYALSELYLTTIYRSTFSYRTALIP